MANDKMTFTVSGIHDTFKEIAEHCNGCEHFRIFLAGLDEQHKPSASFVCTQNTSIITLTPEIAQTCVLVEQTIMVPSGPKV